MSEIADAIRIHCEGAASDERRDVLAHIEKGISDVGDVSEGLSKTMLLFVLRKLREDIAGGKHTTE